MKNYKKYTRQYFLPPHSEYKWTEKDYIDKAPIWCSVDLRDGNQALIAPMNLEEKLDFFKMLVSIGFKEIEIGFPAASETEYTFCRTLIEKNLIPDDVSIQVLTQSREHIIAKTFEALEGAKNAIIHLYNSTSLAQREQVFKKSRKEIIELAVSGAELCKKYRENTKGNFRFEYSPESFTGTELDFALEICNSVIDVWEPKPDDKVIINLPVTVEFSMPHIYANQIEYMCNNLRSRKNIIVSLHTHNDRGCAIADSEMGLLAGAERLEGTLFGNGERTGNADIINLAMNMFSQGIDPELDFSDIPELSKKYERVTHMPVNPRHPYCGQLVFAAFSGSHQDAIAKGMKWREEHSCTYWNVPYLPIDPVDVGRRYESDVIRINSQSGKGGIGYILEQKYGFNLPAKMREVFGYYIKGVSDIQHKELLPDEIFEIFKKQYINISSPYKFIEAHYVQNKGIDAAVTLIKGNKSIRLTGHGNGRLDAVSNAIKNNLGLDYSLLSYNEHALSVSSQSIAVSYVCIKDNNDNYFWGSGTDDDIIVSSVHALISCINKLLESYL